MNKSWSIGILALATFVVSTSQFIIVGLLDQVARSLGVTVATAGQLITVFAIAYALGTPVVIALTARWAKRSQLLLALGMALVGIGALLASDNFGVALAARAVLGVASGVFSVTAYAYAAQLAEPGRQGRAMSLISLGSSVSLVLGIPLGRIIAAAWGWLSIFWILGALVVAAAVVVVRFVPPARPTAPIPLKAQFAYLGQPRVLLALVVALLMFVAYSSTNTYITPLLSSLVPNEQLVSLVLLGLGLASLIGSQLAGFLSDRFGVGRPVLIGVAVQASALALIPLMHGTPAVAVAATLLWTLATWGSGPALLLNLVSIAPEAAGILLSLNSSFIQFGFALGSVAGGAVLGMGDVSGVAWVGVAACVACGILALFSFAAPKPVVADQRSAEVA